MNFIHDMIRVTWQRGQFHELITRELELIAFFDAKTRSAFFDAYSNLRVVSLCRSSKQCVRICVPLVQLAFRMNEATMSEKKFSHSPEGLEFFWVVALSVRERCADN